MIRALTLLIFVITPIVTAVGWLLSGPLLALALLVLVPLVGLGAVVLRLRRSPDATAALLARRDDLTRPDED